MTCADMLYRIWQEAIARRDGNAKAAYEAAWQKGQREVEEARARYMEALNG
jgi:hypothetical protein